MLGYELIEQLLCEHDASLWKYAEESQARKKNWVHQLMKRKFTVKYLGNLENSLCCPNFPYVVPKFLHFPCLENFITKFPVFPVPLPL